MPNVIRSSIPVTIANGTALSPAVDLMQARFIGIEMPAAWTAAAISFQGSSDGVTFTDLFGVFAEISVSAAASRTVMFFTSGGVPSATVPTSTGLDNCFPRFVKIRSGLTGGAVNQGADRLLRVLLTAEG